MTRFGRFPERYGVDRKPLCKWCGGAVPKGRRYFCSNEHAFEVQIRRDASFLRARVKERDKGVCAECGIDTKQLWRVLNFSLKALSEIVEIRGFANWFWFNRTMAEFYGHERWKQVTESCKWEADHVVEVVDGGSPYLDNVRTLCVPCHKVKTKASHAERARKRRESKQPRLAEVERCQ